MIFKINRCDSSIKGHNCASDAEIETYLKGFSIMTWVIE